ncbi:hypothetical protein V1512DRAFT_277253 [Lipomyces arxii]|uniref:uncharacterized protein n=1 Tax=Lipomyces arxii TaxID=56418 RepID=UPI0034CD0B8E
MMFGPAMLPVAWYLVKGIWNEYQRRPPLWITYEPEPFPEVTYYDSICGIKHPEIFGGCEDIKIYGDLAIVSCDPYKKQSNFLTGHTPGTPSGSVYIWNYVEDSVPIPIDFGVEFGELRPQGVHGLYMPSKEDPEVPGTETLRLFISNAAKNASVEVVDLDIATGAVSKVVSLYSNEAILDPAAVAPISPTEVFITNTLGYPYRSIVGTGEFLSGIPLGTIGFMDFTNMNNITSKHVGGSTTPVGLEYVGDNLYVASLQYGVYKHQLYIPPDDLDPEEVANNKSLGRMHFYPGENIFRVPYLPVHISYSKELSGLVVAGVNSYSGEIKAWYGKKSASWAGLLVERTDEEGKPLIVSDTVSLGLKSSDRKWQTVFWDPTGEHFSGMKSMSIENGRRFGVSPHQAGVLICNTNGLETVIPPAESVKPAAQDPVKPRQQDQMGHMYLAKDEL